MMKHTIIYTLFAAVTLAAVPAAAVTENRAAAGTKTATGIMAETGTATEFEVEAAVQEPKEQLTRAELKRRARLFDEHTVRMGETAFSIARGYAISPVTFAKDNPDADLNHVRVGQVLLIRKKARGKTDFERFLREWTKVTGTTGEPEPEPDLPPDEEEPEEPEEPKEPVLSPLDSTWNALSGRRPQWERSGGRRGLGREWSFGGGREFGSATSRPPHIALMLPLTGTGANPAGNDFTDLYKGVLLGLEHLKAEGRSATVTLYNTERSTDKVLDIVTSADFIDTDLIIGPVYEDEMGPVVRFGEYFGIPVVSPLSTVRDLDSGVLFQMAPDAATKYDKLRPMLEGDVNIIVVSSGEIDDADFAAEITDELAKLGREYRRFTLPNSRTGARAAGTGGSAGEISSQLDWEKPNVLIVLAGGEQGVDRALSSISSSYNNASARRGRKADISVIGNSRWAAYNSTNDLINLYFKLGVKFVTNYYIDSSDGESRQFKRRYSEVYGDFSSRAAFRGYDAVALFAGALFEEGFSFIDRLEKIGAIPLGTPYRFVPSVGGDNAQGDNARDGNTQGDSVQTTSPRYVNDQWTLVSYSPDYNITIQ